MVGFLMEESQNASFGMVRLIIINKKKIYYSKIKELKNSENNQKKKKMNDYDYDYNY